LHEKPASTFSQRALDASSRRIVKHSVVIAGHRTSVSLEDAFWRALKEIAAQEGVSLAALVARVDAGRGEANLSSALRVFVLERALERLVSDNSGHSRAVR
jgi:predicted DNA-binding ribbon-helix-helix protein